MYEPTGKIDSKKQASAFSPNFVHSLDASALMFTLQAAKSKGISCFSMVHDSFATHAADTQLLANTIRSSFVSMYTNFDILNDLRDEIQSQCPEQLPEVPSTGHLNIAEVLESDYFFA